MAVADYTLVHRGVEQRENGNVREVRARLAVSRDGQDIGELRAGKNRYSVDGQTANEVGIRSDLLTGEDLFVVADEIDPDGSVYFKVFVKPLVNLIWLAGIAFILGSLIAFWPDVRERRRLAERYQPGVTPARA